MDRERLEFKPRFDAVYYYVADLDRAVAFYSEVLGLALRSRDVVARFDLDGVLIELVPTADAARFTGQGNARVCFRVDDLESASAALEARHVAVEAVQVVEGGRLARFHDPDGNELALWEYGGAGSAAAGQAPR